MTMTISYIKELLASQDQRECFFAILDSKDPAPNLAKQTQQVVHLLDLYYAIMIPPCGFFSAKAKQTSPSTHLARGTARLPVTWAKGSTKLNSGIAAADLKSKV